MKELIIFHPEKRYLDDLRPLQGYIRSELNIQELVFSSDEVRCGVKYRVSADWPTLGRKLRKNLGQVKSGLAAVASDDVKAYLDSGSLTVNGVNLVTGDLIVTRYVEAPSGQFATNSDNDVVIILDTQIYQVLHEQWMARELINRVQKLRKKAELQPTDDIQLFYTSGQSTPTTLDNAIISQSDMLLRSLRSLPKRVPEAQLEQPRVLVSEEQEIGDAKIVLTIVKA